MLETAGHRKTVERHTCQGVRGVESGKKNRGKEILKCQCGKYIGYSLLFSREANED